MLWDTAGQEEFDALTKAYYRGKCRYIFKKVKYKRPSKMMQVKLLKLESIFLLKRSFALDFQH